MARRSLRHGLIARMFLAFAVLVTINAALIWSYSRNTADRSYDLLLAGAALTILERVAATSEGITVDIPYSALEMVGLARQDRVFYAVTADDALLTGTDGLPQPPEDDGEPAFWNAPFDGETLRMAAQSRVVQGVEGRVNVTVTIGQTRRTRTALAVDHFVNGVAGLAVLSLIGLIFVWLAISRALRPLLSIERELAGRSPSDLARLDVEPPREVESLVRAINDFIARLEAGRQQTEGFIADVAHQTRTALAGLKGQISLARDAGTRAEADDRLARAEDQATRSIRLTNQLLSHAMVIHRADRGEAVEVDLAEVAGTLLKEFARDTALRDVEVDFVCEGADHVIRGDPVSIREALRNLMENALRHGEADGERRIEVRLARSGRDVILSVSDAGPGIAPDERAAVLERFQAVDRSGRVSGLGLSIVKAVADAHRARFALLTSRWGGLRAELRFPVLLILVWIGIATDARAQDTVLVWSATDTAAMKGVIADFEMGAPGIAVEYREFLTTDLHAAILAAPDGGMPDVVISSAMDLQFDLVNRGLAQTLDVRTPPPDWAIWRDELFGFTFEPAVMVYSTADFSPDDLPRTHRGLPGFLRELEDPLRGRIVTYDIASSGVGYLYATQDTAQGYDHLRIADAMGRADVHLACCTSRMIDGVVEGKMLLGFNAIGSYAIAAARRDDRIGVHFFEDYNLVMTRTAFVPRGAANPRAGAALVDYLLSPRGQRVIGDTSGLLPVHAQNRASGGLLEQSDATFLPIRLSAGLLVYLDRIKRNAFLAGWRDAVVQ